MKISTVGGILNYLFNNTEIQEIPLEKDFSKEKKLLILIVIWTIIFLLLLWFSVLENAISLNLSCTGQGWYPQNRRLKYLIFR